MKKNICLLIYDLRSGGAEKVLSQWSTLLNDDFNVFFVLYNKNAEICYPYSGNLVYLDAPSNNKNVVTKVFNVIKRARLLKKFVRKNKIDAVISFCNECNLVNTVSSHKAKKICSIRSASDLNSNKFVNLVVKSKKNKIIIQTEALRSIMIERYGKKIEDKLIVFGNPFNNNNIKNLSVQDAPQSIQEILKDKKTILSVASFKPQKNHSNLLKSFELVAQKLDDVYLLLVGADSTGYKDKVFEMSKKSKFSDRIIFVGELKNPYSVMSKATLFVLPSLAEGIPNVLAEAMICGAPVIATNCPTGPAELLLNDPKAINIDKTGFMVADYGILTKQFENPSDYNYEEMSADNSVFANAILSVLEDENVLNDLRDRAAQGAKRFDIDQYKNNLVELVDSLLK